MRNLLAAISGLAAPSEAQDGGRIFDPGECDVSDEAHIRSVLRDWLSVPLHLARTFGRRKHYPLVFSMAAVECHMHRELEFARGVPFPDVLRSVFKVAAYPQSQG